MTPEDIAEMLTDMERGSLGLIMEADVSSGSGFRFKIYSKGRKQEEQQAPVDPEALPDEDTWEEHGGRPHNYYEPRVILAHEVVNHQGLVYIGINPGNWPRVSQMNYSKRPKPPGWETWNNDEFEEWKKEFLEFASQFMPKEPESKETPNGLPDEDKWGARNRGDPKYDEARRFLYNMSSKKKFSPELAKQYYNLIAEKPRKANIICKYQKVLTMKPENVVKVERI